MKNFGFYLYYPFLKLLSLLPMPVLYLVSDFLYVMVYYVFGYRKKIVYHNLKLSFPEKPEKEIFKIRKQYYRYMCDLIIETVKAFSISSEEILRRVEIDRNFVKQNGLEGQSCIFLLGHLGNWEWTGLAYSAYGKEYSNLHIVYHEIKNEKFNEVMYKMRNKFGAHLSKMEDTLRNMIRLKDRAAITCLVADQNPPPQNAYWADFLNHKTAFFKGPFKLARKFNQPIVYAYIKRVKRGYYKIEHVLISKESKLISEDEIMDKYIVHLEKNIKESIPYWLWSHRRWKHKYEDYHEKA